MKICELIEYLKVIKKEVGDVPVVLSRDSEGNGFGTLKAPYSFGKVRNNEGDKVLGVSLYPFEECYDDIEAVQVSKE